MTTDESMDHLKKFGLSANQVRKEELCIGFRLKKDKVAELVFKVEIKDKVNGR